MDSAEPGDPRLGGTVALIPNVSLELRAIACGHEGGPRLARVIVRLRRSNGSVEQSSVLLEEDEVFEIWDATEKDPGTHKTAPREA